MVRRMWNPWRKSDELTVGLIHWALPPTIGGVETHLADYIGILRSRGVTVVVFTGEPAPSAQILRDAKVEHHPLLHLACGGAKPADRPQDVKELARWLEAKVHEYNVNIIHGHNLHHFSSVPAAAVNIVCTKLDIARHHTFHNYWDDDHECAKLVAGWEGLWATSGFVARQCAQGYGGVPPTPRYMGIKLDRFSCRRRPFKGRSSSAGTPVAKAPVILQPARLLPWKGPIHSVRMLKLLRDKGYAVRLLLTDTRNVLDWDDERKQLLTELTDLITVLGLTEWVDFREGVPYGEMPRLYKEADIVINPSHGEPLGLVPLEAMAASRPVVITDSGGMTETYGEMTGAVVTDDGDLVNHLFEAVKDFLDNPRLAVESGRKGRKHVRKNFDMRTYADDMISEYRRSLPVPVPVDESESPTPEYAASTSNGSTSTMSGLVHTANSNARS
jgi:glycosyltransferase involved in cell wall biosynthesis